MPNEGHQTRRGRQVSATLTDEQLEILRTLFSEQAKRGATVFHQAHAEELLAMADELIARRRVSGTST